MARATSLLLGLSALLVSAQASAQLELRSVQQRLAQQARAGLSRPLPQALLHGRGGGVSVLVRGARGVPELFDVGGFAAGELTPARFLELSRAHPDWSFDWAPPRHVLLDRIEGWVHAQAVREQTQTSGQGVVVGIVDTGLDLAHRDFRDVQGRTRVAWLIDVSRDAAGLQPDLEKRYGCSAKDAGCAIYSGEDLDALTSNATPDDEPSDPFGHGTHVASLAAGNGLASDTPRYIGVAPEATLVIGRVASSNGGILDADVLRAVQFVFDRAEALGMPAVVNLSLGSDFGAHDGSSALEQGLSALVGPRFPGRAIVLAAGNSAGLYDAPGLAYAGPYGIHTEVQVPTYGGTEVPLITPAPSGKTVNGTAYVWIGFREGDAVSVSLVDGGGKQYGPVAAGKALSESDGDLGVDIYNGTVGSADDSSVGRPGRKNAVLILTGQWSADRDFRIRFEGQGSAELWVQGVGDLNPESHLGALFPRAQKEGTINVPSSASGLIAVGATLNRTTWTANDGEAIDLPDLGSLKNAPLDTIAYFSSAGPNALGVVKPDIVAPGVYLAGAMSSSADPRRTSSSLFASLGRCPSDSECFVVDDSHAITSGTSMASPVVAGAIALLFQRDPTLTQDAVRAILQAGARPLEGVIGDLRQVGPGALDLQGALSVATAGESPAARVPTAHSWLTLSASHAHPDLAWPVTGFVELRDDRDRIADGFDAGRLRLAVTGAPLNVDEALTRVAPGFYRFALAAPESSAGQTARVAVQFDDTEIAAQPLPILSQPHINPGGLDISGGCTFAPRSTSYAGLFSAGFALFLLGRRRYMRAK